MIDVVVSAKHNQQKFISNTGIQTKELLWQYLMRIHHEKEISMCLCIIVNESETKLSESIA